MKAIALIQPWAFIVVHGGKRVENRRWNTRFRGEFLIHASKGMTRAEYEDAREFAEDVGGITFEMPPHDSPELHRGGIVGVATLVDVIPPRPDYMPGGMEHHYARQLARDPDFVWRWHMQDQFGFVLEDVRPLPFTPCVGALSFFEVPSDIVERAYGRAGLPPPEVSGQGSLFGGARQRCAMTAGGHAMRASASAARRCAMTQRDEDLRCLRALCAELEEDDGDSAEAMRDMLARLERGLPFLTARQRRYVNDVAERHGIDGADGPSEEGAPEGARFTTGAPPRGREVPSLVGALPLRPPGRR